MAKLTDTSVKNLKPRERDYFVGDGHGLYLRVRPSGSKTWIIRKKSAGQTRIITLGRWPTRTLRAARLQALDPATVEPRQEVDVAGLFNEFYDRIIAPRYRRPHHVRAYLDKIAERLGRRRLDELERGELADFLKAYAKRGRVAANRCLAIARQAFDYAVECGYVEQSPAHGLSRRIAGGEEKSRERVLTDDEIRALWSIPEPHGPLLRFLLLTGCRIGEAQLATRDHIEGEGDLLRIPAEHSKNGRAHLVTLSRQAKALLASQKRGRLFGIRTTTGVQAFLRRWCERGGITPRFTPHDLRRTAATRMNALGIPPHVVEKALNHTMQGVMAIYNRADYLEERKAALAAWGAEVERIIASPGAAS